MSRPGSPQALRDLNRGRVLEALREYGDLSQAELARRTELSQATVSNIIRHLRATGDVVTNDGPGRRTTVRLAPGPGFVVGVDYGHRHISVAVADLDHDVLTEERIDLAKDVSAHDGMAEAARMTERTLRRAGVDRNEVVGAAMGLPAPIDRTTGRVGSPSILPGWVGVNAGDVATEALGLPVRVVVDNDANLGARVEWWWGAGVGYSDVVYLKLSDGVGAGLIIGGHLYGGVAGTAGEIGHTTLDEYGELCRCGNRGCLETVVSARRVTAMLAPVVGEELTISEVVRRAEDGSRACERLLTDVGLQVGRSLADLCSLLNPQMILVGGELAQASALLIPAIERVIGRCGVPAAAESVHIKPGALGARTHVLGTIALARREAGAAAVFNS